MSRIQIISFSILHAITVMLLPFLIFLLGGCVDPTPENTAGPAIPCEQVNEALKKGSEGSFGKIAVDHWVSSETFYTIMNSAPRITGQSLEEVLVKNDHDGYYSYISRRTVTEFKSSGNVTKTDEITDEGPKVLNLCKEGRTFHNLSVRVSRVDPPKLDRCDPYPDCKIEVTDITFDMLIPLATGEKEAHHLTIRVSGDVPYIARILDFCETFPYAANGQKIPATVCDTVKDFDFKKTSQ